MLRTVWFRREPVARLVAAQFLFDDWSLRIGCDVASDFRDQTLLFRPFERIGKLRQDLAFRAIFNG